MPTREKNSTPLASAPRLGDVLLEQGTITAEQLEKALDLQISSRERLGTVLISNGWADEEQIAQARSVQINVPYVAIADEPTDPFVLALIPYETAHRFQVLPLSLQGDGPEGAERLLVVMSNPWDIEAIDLVQRQARRRVEPLLASESALQTAIERAYQDSQGEAHDAAMQDSIEQATQEAEDLNESGEDIDVGEALRQSDQAPVIRFVNTLFSNAVRKRASDIHIEPRRKDFQIRYRIDGQLQIMRTVPRQFLAATTSRIKIMAEMDIAERRLPQDGRIARWIERKPVMLRVSTLPTQYGERIVIRILDRSKACLPLEKIGFSERNAMAFQTLIRKPHGIILVTGPTGSGKTTTLYAALNALKSPTTNILTCEDPVEYEFEGISQSQINERAGLTFARQLRALLRQDPDVILVGEIRDQETAEIAFRAALTGHLVLSTLHCNEAAGAMSRLLDMGVQPFLIASTLTGAVAQRLVRALCPHCRRPAAPTDTERTLYEELGGMPEPDLRFYQPVGCVHCDKTGFHGRIPIHEVLTVNSRIHRLTMEQAETQIIREAAVAAGMIPMIEDGLSKVVQGLTTFEEVLRKVNTIGED